MSDDPANLNVPYDWELTGHPAFPIRNWHPLPVLDLDIETQLRRSTLHIIREAAPRLATMGIEAIAECHALGHPAWVEDSETGRIVRLDPDGKRHFEDRTTAQIRADRPTSPRSPTCFFIAALMIVSHGKQGLRWRRRSVKRNASSWGTPAFRRVA
ncbi:MAG: hypothetical protein ACRYGP_01035 [Janthinobacterium lividum]